MCHRVRGEVEKDVDVSLKLAALDWDRDRTMVVAAELEFAVSGLSESTLGGRLSEDLLDL